MSIIWNFSPSLQDQVQMCISAARKDDQNKWVQEFGHLTRNEKVSQFFNCNKLAETTQPIEISSENVILEDKVDIEVSKIEKTGEFDGANIDEIIDSLETEFSTRVDLVIDECIKTSKIIHALSLKLSIPMIEKLCKYICNKKDINREFLSKYFECFVPNYIKRSYNSSVLDILIICYRMFPLQFKLLLEILIRDMEIPKQVLQDFVQSLSENEQSNFITDLSEFDLTSEQFSRNLFSIYNAYKDCKKSERIQNYVQSLIIQHSSFCAADRHFGRLLLSFLNAQKSLKLPINSDNIENVIENHRSPFKRPCVMLLKELTGDIPNETASDDDFSD